MERRRRWSFSFGIKIFWVQSLASARKLMAITSRQIALLAIFEGILYKNVDLSQKTLFLRILFFIVAALTFLQIVFTFW